MRLTDWGFRVAGVFLIAATVSIAQAADLKILAAGAFAAVFKELGPQFERDTGHKLLVTISATSGVRKTIDAGEYFDLVVTNTPAIDEWAQNGVIVTMTKAPIAYTGLGLGVKAGAPKPDISTVDASRHALLNATSVAHGAESASAAAFETLLVRLGISEQMKPRLRPMGPGVQTKSVASGETEMLVAVVPSIVSAPGVELAGSFPSALQTYTTFAAAVSSKSKETDGARAVILLLTSPAAQAIFRTQGMGIGMP